jgi:hypothetical protein
MCLHVLFSFQRTDPARKGLGHAPDAHSPRLAGPDQPRIGRIQGNLLRLLQPFPTVNPPPLTAPGPGIDAKAAAISGLGKTFRPAVRLGSPETRELGDYERRRETRYYAPRKGLSTPRPGAQSAQELPHIRQVNPHANLNKSKRGNPCCQMEVRISISRRVTVRRPHAPRACRPAALSAARTSQREPSDP